MANSGFQLITERLSNLNAATNHNYIDIGAGAVKVVVTDISAYDIGFDTSLVNKA